MDGGEAGPERTARQIAVGGDGFCLGAPWLNPSARSISLAGVQCDRGHGRSERTDTRESGAHCFWVVVRGIKVLITVRSAALAVFLSIAAIPAFLLLTGTDVVVAVVGAVAAIAMWLGFGWVVDRLFSEWF